MRINESVTSSDAGAIAIVVAQPEDIPALQRTAAISWWATYSDYLASSFIEDFLTRAYSAHQLAAHFADPKSHFLVAKFNHDLIGFGQAGPAMARDDDAPVAPADLYRLYLLPEWQGKGIGSRLLAGLEIWLRQQGYPYYGAYVDERNEPAKSFYARQGFVHKPECDIPEQWYLVKQLE
jgi:GNAT superfamily N-acetyltransferase